MALLGGLTLGDSPRPWRTCAARLALCGICLVGWTASGCGTEGSSAASVVGDSSASEARSDTSGSCGEAACKSAGAECGKMPDGCGGVVDCGSCETGTCGGGGPNRCGQQPCVRKTCAGVQAQCGLIPDGCGDVVNCGGCDGGVACSNNKCGCRTCASLGWECGTGSDNCGGTLNCGTCDSGTCEAHKCQASTGCQADEKECETQCVSLVDPQYGCSATDCEPCEFQNADAYCSSSTGECEMGKCLDGWEDCDTSPTTGCEAALGSDPKNCGTCGNDCTALPHVSGGPGELCQNGKCVPSVGCNVGYGDCDGEVSTGCETQWSAQNCGACGKACPSGFVCSPEGMPGAPSYYCNCDDSWDCSADPGHPGTCSSQRCHCSLEDGGVSTCKRGVPCAPGAFGCAS